MFLKNLCKVVCLVALTLGANAHAQFSEPGAFVTQVTGEAVVISAETGKPITIPTFAKLEPGAKVKLAAGARLQILYFESAKQENWSNAAEFQVSDQASQLKTGAAPAVRELPAEVVESIGKSVAYFSNPDSRQAMVRLRAVSSGKIKAAQSHYRELRAQLPDEDITPEIYLLGQLEAMRAYREMGVPMAEMRRRQPGSLAVQALHKEYERAIASATTE
jgi:hypothetical protein